MLLVICITTSCKKDKTKQSPKSYRVTFGNKPLELTLIKLKLKYPFL
jgi:hypothetical protein